MKKMPPEFYQREDVVKIAKELLGKLLVTRFNGTLTSGRIVETEAYNGIVDKASHAYGGRRTKRTEVIFGAAGYAYVYLCYGIHHMFNVVTNDHGTPHAILIRGIEPVHGKEIMTERFHKTTFNKTIGKGPGNVTRALGIQTSHSGYSLLGDEIFIADDGFVLQKSQVIASPRIGIDYAGEDANLLYRFFIRDNPFVSRVSLKQHSQN
jgi:DNA-3-methyladenine glycosylase